MVSLASFSGASAPVLSGLLSDSSNVDFTLKVIALVTFATVPLCKFLLRLLAQAEKMLA